MNNTYAFRAGTIIDPESDDSDVYSINIIRRDTASNGTMLYQHLELMRTQGDVGYAYLLDSVPKFSRMLADHGPARTQRAAQTWGRLHGATIQPWQDITTAERKKDIQKEITY